MKTCSVCTERRANNKDNPPVCVTLAVMCTASAPESSVAQMDRTTGQSVSSSCSAADSRNLSLRLMMDPAKVILDIGIKNSDRSCTPRNS